MPEGKVVTSDIDIHKIIDEMINEASKRGGGALTIFIGYVKGIVDNCEVYSLNYEVYEPYASKKLQEIAENACSNDKVIDVRIYHKVGTFKPGDKVLYVLISSIDRTSGIETLREVIEKVKKSVPIFKLECRSDGDYWIISDNLRIKRR